MTSVAPDKPTASADITVPTNQNVTVANNDSYAIGNLVVVNMKISITANINKNTVLARMPAAINNGELLSNNFHSRVLCTDGTNSFTPYSLFLLTRGDIYTTEALTAALEAAQEASDG